MQKIRVAIWGTGSIANRVMADFKRGANYELTAVCSRNAARAEAFRQKYQLPRAIEGLKALAEDPAVDLVYVASPHPFHFADALTLIENGKHLVVEKPFTLNDCEAEILISAAKHKNLFIMEAMWTRFLPAMMDLKTRIDSGIIGDIRLITGNFGYANAFDPESRIFKRSLGGGSLMDVGVYPLNLAMRFLGNDAKIDCVSVVKTPTDVDGSMAFQLSWENGACAQLFSAVDTMTDSRAAIYGTRGYIEIPDFWHATRYRVVVGGKAEDYTFDPENEGHYHQFEHAAECIRNGKTESDIMPHEDTIQVLKIMTELRRITGISYPEEKIDA